MNITNDDIATKIQTAITNLSAMGLGISYPCACTIPHMLVDS